MKHGQLRTINNIPVLLLCYCSQFQSFAFNCFQLKNEEDIDMNITNDNPPNVDPEVNNRSNINVFNNELYQIVDEMN